MLEQQLLTDLAVAEKNSWSMIKFYDVSYVDEVNYAFQKNNVFSYFDLVQVDLRKAMELRKIAIGERLL